MKQILISLSILSMAFAAQSYEVDAAKSEFKWTGKKVTGQHYGKIPLKKAQVKSKGKDISGGTLVLDVTQITVEDLTGEYKTKFLTHMKSEDFFEVKKWPTAKLEIESLKDGKAKGKLTIKGKTNPVEFNYTKKGMVYSGTLKFDRTKYDMIYGSGDFFKNLGDKMIYNEVTLDFKVQLKGKPSKLAKK